MDSDIFSGFGARFLASLVHIAGSLLPPYLLLSLPCALAAAALYVATARWRKGKPLRLKLLRRALFPSRYIWHVSGRVDFAYYLFNMLVYGLAFGWAVLSYRFFADAAAGALTALFGAPAPAAPPQAGMRAFVTLALFLAYELA